MRIVDVESRQVQDKVRLSAKATRDGKADPIDLHFEYPQEFYDWIRPGAEPFIPLLLIPCMSTGEDLASDVPVSDRLLRGTVEIQNAMCGMFPRQMRRVRFTAPSRPDSARAGPERAASFFSLGVDSFYTARKTHHGFPSAAPPVEHLIYMRGLEFPLGQEPPDQSFQTIRSVAQAYGLNLIAGSTNARDHFNLPWGTHYLGAVLGGIALSLSGGLSHVLIPSCWAIREQLPWGSHPAMDGWWSCEGVQIIHDGCESTRAEKTQRVIAADAAALSNLRVCLKSRDTARNCGRCGKCIRTMICLEILGKLEHTDAFPRRFPDDLPELIRMRTELDYSYGRDNLDLAARLGVDNQRVRLLESAARRYASDVARDRYLANAPLLTRYIEMTALGRIYRLLRSMGVIPPGVARRITSW